MHLDVPAAAIVGVVPGKDIQPRVDRDLVDVARAATEQFEFRAIGPDAHHATAMELQRSAIGSLCLHEAEVTDGEIEPPIDGESHAVARVVGRPLVEIEPDAGDQVL